MNCEIVGIKLYIPVEAAKRASALGWDPALRLDRAALMLAGSFKCTE